MRVVAAMGLVCACCVAPVRAEDLSVVPKDQGKIVPVEMMQRYLTALADEALARRRGEYEKLKTPDECRAYQARLRKFFVEQLGGFPERSPLNARIAGTDQRDGYRVEKVLFESQPKHLVSGLLYLPNVAPPYPGVIVPCGHSANGKAAEAYQRVSILLAKNGIASFCYDPIGQGERLQILPREGQAAYSSTVEHTLVGVGSILLGTNTARYRVWDGMRALDYLASRPDIDPQRLGCTGNSGGGTLTSYLMALDDRIACAAPSCYLTSWEKILEKAGAQDAEQNIHAQIAFGMNHADYVMLRAPQPTLMCVATRDFFDIDGAWDSFRQAKRFYGRLGRPECVELVEADEVHGFTRPLREGATRWMRRWLLDEDDAIVEGEFAVASDEQCRVTPAGQTLLVEGARSVFDLNADWLARLESQRKQSPLEGAALRDAARRLAGIRKLSELPAGEPLDFGLIERKGYEIRKLVVRMDVNIALPTLLFTPSGKFSEVVVYAHGEGKHVDAVPGGPIEQLVLQGKGVAAIDVRGLGETHHSRDTAKGFDEHFDAEWKNWFLSYMLDRTYVGMRADDLLVVAKSFADAKFTVHLVGIGEAGVPALHAAAVEPDLFASVTLRRTLASWADVVRSPEAKRQLTNCVHGALRAYDLPDLVASLKGKITIEEPVDARQRPIGTAHERR